MSGRGESRMCGEVLLTVDRSRNGHRASGPRIDVAQGEGEGLQAIGADESIPRISYLNVYTRSGDAYLKLFSS